MNSFSIKCSTALAAIGLSCSVPAAAVQFDLGPASVNIENRASAGLAWRVENRDPNRVAIGNGGNAFSSNSDDGNLAFDNGDLVASTFKLTSDLRIEWGDFGVFVRGSYLYDPTLEDQTYFSADDYGPGTEAPVSERRFKHRRVRGHIGHDGDILDAYLFGNFDIAGTDIAIRIGKQHLSWGETVLIRNGMDSIGAIDANQLRVPGFALDEVFTPLSMVWASVELPLDANLEVFYQLDWQQTEPDVAGSFLSSSDFVGIGATRANIGFGRADENTPGTSLIRVADREPGDSGQFGAALHVFVPALGDADIGIYAANYHSRLPVFSGTSSDAPQSTQGANYFIEYPEDIQLYGISFNAPGPVGLALQGEYSYKVDQPLQIDDVELLLTGLGIPSQINPQLGGASGNQYLRGWRRHDVSQLNLSATQLFAPSKWLRYDQLLMVVELGVTYVHDLPPTNQLRYEGPGTFTPGFDPATDGQFRGAFLASQNLPAQSGGYATDTSWGYRAIFRATYHNVIGPLKLLPGLRFEHDVNGVSPAPIINFVEQRKTVATSLGFDVGTNWEAEIGYTLRFDGGRGNQLSDRDAAHVSFKYFF